MVDDYLSDREQEEALRNWWRDNWRWIVGGVVAGVAILIGWNSWQSHRERSAVVAAEVYSQLQSAVDAQDLDAANTHLNQLTSDHSGLGYVQQGRLLVAKLHFDAGQYDEAATLYRGVVKDADDKLLADVARLRLARVLIQQEQYDAALQQLDPKTAGAFAARVREARGDALFAKGDLAGARAEYAAALADNADAQTDRTLLEMKLQQVDTPAESDTSAEAASGGAQ